MFDPSKLDLDLENNKDKKEINKTKQEENKNIQNSDKNKEDETLNTQEDVLENLNDSEETKAITEIDGSDSVLKELTNSIKDKEIKEEDIGKTEYEKSIKKENKNEEKTEKKNEKTIFDINITSIDVILSILVDKKYDFATFEPSEESVKIIFRKDKVIKETKYIKYPIFSNILVKAKAISKLTIEETENQQEGTGEMTIRNDNYKISTKVVPSDLGSKLFIKAQLIEKKLTKKAKKKTSLSQIFTFLGAIAFITLVIGGSFLGFVILNAKTVDDVKFFYSLGINLNDINTFMSQAIAVIFSILIFIETVFLVIYLFKFSLTKKEFKQKKIRYGIISTIVLIFAFSTASAWMIIDQKIKSLPNWQEKAYGDIQVFDNSKLVSESFNKEGSFLKDTSNLIGPVEIKFDLSNFQDKEERKGFTIQKYIWDFGNGKIKETPVPTIIYNFTKKGNHEVKLVVEEVNIQGELIEKVVENIPSINISYVVDINEKKINNGGKLVDFDASSLKELGQIEWYFIEDLDKPVWTGDIFRMGKPIFEETLIGMYIKRNDKESEQLDKLFIIKGEDEINLYGEIKATISLLNDLEYELTVENIENDFGNGYIEEFKWIIGDKEITNKGDVTNPEESSKIMFEFENYGEHKVTVIIKDSAGETKEITTTVDVPRKLKLSRNLQIYNEENLIKNVNYQEKLNEYYIDELGIPTSIKFDARFIKSSNLLYTLNKVDWDYNSDGDIDKSSKIGNYDVSVEGNHTITVFYEFSNRKIFDDIIVMKEQIFIEGLRKEAIVDFDIKKDSEYVPVIVGFDASQSQVKGENIEKFIWDYGDGISEERDAIVPGHRYTTPGDYEVKLKVVTTTGKEFSYSKKLILKPKPQAVKITTSMKRAPILQGIDFSSEKSEGQIIGYFWDFGDGETSTEANPTHSYRKTGNYEISLKLDFINKNILEDVMQIEIFKE